jgi:hypothetical protein
MTRSFLLTGLFGLVGVGLLGALPLACGGGGVGDPCIPEDEYDAQFPGFTLSLENIESRSFQCQTRICLVNHFEGRVSCPLGQPEAHACGTTDSKGNVVGNDSECGTGEKCVESVPIAQDCDPTIKTPQCPPPGACNATGKFCECADKDGNLATPPADGYSCDTQTKQFRAFFCHKTGNCQTADPAAAKDNCDASGNPKDCCVPGTDIPVQAEVSGQCDGNRSADNAVYCSCRCDVAPGQPKDPNFNFCSCPTGFSCSLIRPFEGLGQPELAGSYCIKTGTEFNSEPDAELHCNIAGHYPLMDGVGTSTGKNCSN